MEAEKSPQWVGVCVRLCMCRYVCVHVGVEGMLMEVGM